MLRLHYKWGLFFVISNVMEVFTMETLIIKHTVRGGKDVVHEGDVVVLGDVYPSACIIAGGNITVMGTAKGSLTAGKTTGDSAVIVANNFQCPYVRVGRFSARQESPEPSGPMYLMVEKGQLVSKDIKTAL